MLEKLVEMDHKITNDDWKQSDIQEFMDKWGKHIIHADMAFNAYQKEQEFDAVD
jgi:cytochrome c2